MLTQASNDTDSDVLTMLTMKADLTVPQGFNAQISTLDLDTPKQPMQGVSGILPQQYLINEKKSCSSPSTSTTHHIHKGLATASSLHAGEENCNLGHTSIPNVSKFFSGMNLDY